MSENLMMLTIVSARPSLQELEQNSRVSHPEIFYDLEILPLYNGCLIIA